MAYTALTFVSGEVLTATKMNLLAANDASFHDGTGLGDGTINTSKLDWSTIQPEDITSKMTVSDAVTVSTNIAYLLKLYSYKNLVWLAGDFTIAANTAAFTQLLLIPAGYRAATGYYAQTSADITITVQKNGQIRNVTSVGSSAKDVYLSVMWLTK